MPICQHNSNQTFQVLSNSESWCFLNRSRDSSVGIATDYGLDGRGSFSGRKKYIFLSSTASRLALGPAQPPIQCVLRTFSVGVKLPGREAHYSLPSDTKVKNFFFFFFYLVGWDLTPIRSLCRSPRFV
jgi:hypothetical protein